MMNRTVLALLAMLLPLVGNAAEARFRDWQRQCESLRDGKQACHIAQQVFNPDTHALAMRVEVGFTPQRLPLLLVTLPLGVALRPGIIVSIDGHGQWPVSFDVCSRDGCRAATLLDAELLTAMKRGNTAELTIADLSGRKITVPLSLLGFTRGYASISD